jgi:hypothetical protein
MLKTKYCLGTALVCFIASDLALAEVSLIPRVSTGIIDYSLTTPAVPLEGGVVFPEYRADRTLYLIGVGGTVVEDKFYMDIYAQTTSKDDNTLNASTLGYQEIFDGKRDDYSVSFGYAVTDDASLYAGYKSGKSSTKGKKGSTSDFKEDGFFIGGTYGWLIQDLGILSLNLAVARLDGNIKFENDLLPINGTAETVGITYGVAWKANVNESLGYGASLSYYNYVFDGLKDKRLGNVSGEIEEKMLTLKISLSYAIDTRF